jgi:hypothetical protein
MVGVEGLGRRARASRPHRTEGLPALELLRACVLMVEARRSVQRVEGRTSWADLTWQPPYCRLPGRLMNPAYKLLGQEN